MAKPVLHYRIDVDDPSTQYIKVSLDIEAIFEENILEISFPRWVPGSYFIREPMQYVSEINAIGGDNAELMCRREGVDRVKISGVKNQSKISISWELICREMTVRSTHVDSSHIHMMPPFTFMFPTRGIDSSWKDNEIKFSASLPKSWDSVTQMKHIETSANGENRVWTYTSENRDRFLDSILEANPNPSHSWNVDGREHILKLWDSGGYHFDEEMVAKFIEDATKIIKEHNAIFGPPEWNTYITVLHFTNTSRGGLEHEDSQTSMMPRKSLMPGNKSEYLDLISLFSHEYLHQWNVKRLRPRNFIDYNLQREVNTDLLWWFEGGTSWMGDMICLRSGAWDEKQYRKDFTRKLKRHYARNGADYESLAESSHDAWIHLYRRHEFSSERQVNYYLEGELAIFVLDSEMRKRNKGKYGVDELMSRLYRKHSIEVDDENHRGITRKTIRSELVSIPGCLRLGKLLDELMYERKAPDVSSAMKNFGIELTHEEKNSDSILDQKPGWLGINLSIKPNSVKVQSHLQNSPSRAILMPGDELIHLDKIRISDSKTLSLALNGKEGQEIVIGISREGIYQESVMVCGSTPQHKTIMKGNGNSRWKNAIETRIIS